MLELNNIEIRYQRFILAVKGMSLSVPERGFVTLLGPNGSGKSSVLKGIAGLLPLERGDITAGSITYDGARIDHMRPERIARKRIVLVPEGRRIFGELTAEENLLVATYTRRGDGRIKEDLEKVYRFFPRLMERRTMRAGYLSGGELQMLAIGRALMVKPRFLILDEPSLGLAPMLVETILDMLRDLHRNEDITMLLVEQFAENALALSDYVYIIEKGQVVIEGKPPDIQENKNVQEFYLGIVGSKKKKMGDIKFYRRKKRWFS